MMATTLLTARQSEVVARLRMGDTNKEIAAQLGITDDAVKAHLSRLYLRFGVANRVALLNALGGNGVGADVSGDLGQLRSAARRLRASSSMRRTGDPGGSHATLETLRQALAAVDAALDLAGDLPDETRGPLIEAVRRRIESGFAALDELQRSLGAAPRSAAAS